MTMTDMDMTLDRNWRLLAYCSWNSLHFIQKRKIEWLKSQTIRAKVQQRNTI